MREGLTGSATAARRQRPRMLSKRGSAVIDARTNQLFVQDIAVASSRRCAS